MKLKIALLIILTPILIVLSWAAYVLATIPELIDLNSCFVAKMNEVRVCPNTPQYTRIDDISQNVIDAITISEDAGFWHHNGLDWHELKISMKVNLKAGGFKRGGSTISQQLIKNIHFSGKKTLTRKLKEALLALEMEKRYSKKVILEKYLNTVEFGPEIFGVTAAANHYFSKPPSQLNVLESAFLAFLLPNPTGYYENFRKSELSDFARKMILLITKRLYFYKKISADEYVHATANIDRFPWYGVIDHEYNSEILTDLESMDEDTLEDEFQRILKDDIPLEEVLTE